MTARVTIIIIMLVVSLAIRPAVRIHPGELSFGSRGHAVRPWGEEDVLYQVQSRAVPMDFC